MGKIYYEDPVTKELCVEITSPNHSPKPSQTDIELQHPGPSVAADLKRWPEEPQPIVPTFGMKLVLIAYDCLLCLVPIALIIKAGLCVAAYQIDKVWTGIFISSVSPLSRYLVQFNQQLTTVFTLFFIMIVSTAVRRYALWKAERGATVAELEQYQASISLTSTLKAIWSLRAFTYTSLGLMFVWSWYYIGSQAAQREYRLVDSLPLTQVEIAVESATSLSPFEDGSWGDISRVQRTDMTAQYHIYNKKVETAQNFDGSDVAGNALIPLYDTGMDYAHRDGWVTWNKETPDVSYSSAIGDVLYVRSDETDVNPLFYYGSPTTNTSADTWTTQMLIGKYQYTTSYIYADCSNVTLNEQNQRPAGLYPALTMSLNISSEPTSYGAMVLDFWSQYNSTMAVHASCAMTRINVEVGVNCLANGCKATQMRTPVDQPDNTTTTPFSNPGFVSNFTSALLFACGVPDNVNDTTSFEKDNGLTWLTSDLNDVYGGSSGYNTVQAMLDDLYPSYITRALTRHINTFYMASKIIKLAATFETENAENGYVELGSTNAEWTYFHMKGAAYNPQYRLFVPWLIVDLMSCTVLLACAVVAFWLRTQTLAPDIFGYVSSLTRGNPHLDVPGGSTLSGFDRSRRMKHVRVQVGDVASDTGAGKIGLTYVGDGEQRATYLDKSRRYV